MIQNTKNFIISLLFILSVLISSASAVTCTSSVAYCQGSLLCSVCKCFTCTYGTVSADAIPFCGFAGFPTVCLSPPACTSTQYLSGSTCASCSAAMPNCNTCTSASACTACISNSYILFGLNTECRICSSVMNYCSTCSSSTVCTSCTVGAGLAGNTCFPCVNSITNCI